MENFVSLSLLLAALAVVVYLSPDPLYVRSVSAEGEEGDGAAASLLKNVQGATRDAYQSAAEYAERTGDGIRQTGANMADRLSSLVGGKPEYEEVRTEPKPLLDRAAEAIQWRSQQEESILSRAAEAMDWRSKQEKQRKAETLSRASESTGGSGLGDHTKEVAHEVEDVSNWRRVKEKLNEASHAASEAASHVKGVLFRKSIEGTHTAQETTGQTTDAAKHEMQEKAQSTYATLQDTAAKAKDTIENTLERAMETLTSAKDIARERLHEGAQSTYSTLQDAAGMARDTLGSTTDRARETMGSVFSSTHETASQGVNTAYDTGARSLGSAYKAAGDYSASAYETAGDYCASAYKSATDYGSSAYNTARDRAAEAFDLASEKAGSTYETVSIAVQILTGSVRAIPTRTAEYARSASDRLGSAMSASEMGSPSAAGSASSVYDTVKKAPESVQGTMEYVKRVFPDMSTQSWKQRAKEAGEYLPNVGEGLSYGTNAYEGVLENLRQKMSFGRSDEERKGIIDEFKNSLSGYSHQDQAGIMDILKEKLGYAPRDEPKAPQTRGLEDEGFGPNIETLSEKLVSAPSGEERRGILEEVKGMLGGYSREERKGIIDGLKEKLASYIPGTDDEKVTDTATGKLIKSQEKAFKTVRGERHEKGDSPREDGASTEGVGDKLVESARGGQDGAAWGFGVDYLRQAVGGGKDREEETFFEYLLLKLGLSAESQPGHLSEEESFFEYLKQKLGIGGISHNQGPDYEGGKQIVASAGEQAKEFAGRSTEMAREKLRDGDHHLTNHGGVQNDTSVRDSGEECGVDKRMNRVISKDSEKIRCYIDSAGNLIPDDDSDGTEFYAWIRDQQAREQACECNCSKDGSARDAENTVGGEVADVEHPVVDTGKEKTVEAEQQHEPAETRGIENTPFGMNYLESLGPAVATASTVEKISKPKIKPESKPENDKGADEKFEQAAKAPAEGFFTSLGRLFHLAAFAFSYGTSMWMTFLSGQVLSKIITRHQFAQVQSRLFPAYLKAAASGQAVVFLMQWFRHPFASSDFSDKFQFINLCFTLAANLINIYYLEPQVSMVMFERFKLEKEEASEDAHAASTAKNDAAHWTRQFNILHGYSSLMNFISLVGQTWHLWYLSRRLVI